MHSLALLAVVIGLAEAYAADRQFTADSVLVLDFMATVFPVGTARLGVRLYHEEFRRAAP